MRKGFITLRERYLDSALYRHVFSAIAHPKNFFFCLKYPFMKARNVWSGRFCGYGFTMLDQLDEGWKKAFGQKLCEDIAKAFKGHGVKKKDWSKQLLWQEIKEKWGQLCLYATAPDYIEDILHHYENISSNYCCRCGKPSKYWSRGWIAPYCEDCKKCLEEYHHVMFDEMEKDRKH